MVVGVGCGDVGVFWGVDVLFEGDVGFVVEV